MNKKNLLYSFWGKLYQCLYSLCRKDDSNVSFIPTYEQLCFSSATRHNHYIKPAFQSTFRESLALHHEATNHDADLNVDSLPAPCYNFQEENDENKALEVTNAIINDFNNQLSIILSTANILSKKTSENDQLYTYCKRILKASKRSAEYAHQLIENLNPQEINKEPVNIHSIIKELDDLLQDNIETNISVHKKLWADEYMSYGCCTQLKNALLNLFLYQNNVLSRSGILSCWTENIKLVSNMQAVNDRHIKAGSYIKITISDTCISSEDSKSNGFPSSNSQIGNILSLNEISQIFESHNGYIDTSKLTDTQFCISTYLPIIQN